MSPEGGDRSHCGGSPPGRCTTPPIWWSHAGSTSWSPVVMELGERHTQGDRPGPRPGTRPCARPPRRSRSCCHWVAPCTAEGDVGAAGHEPTVARVGWVVGGPRPAGRGVGHRDRPDPGQGPGPPGGRPGRHRVRAGGTGAGRPGVAKAIDGRTVRKVVVRAPKLVNVVVWQWLRGLPLSRMPVAIVTDSTASLLRGGGSARTGGRPAPGRDQGRPCTTRARTARPRSWLPPRCASGSPSASSRRARRRCSRSTRGGGGGREPRSVIWSTCLGR